MQADDLKRGDTFVECSEDAWRAMSPAERNRQHVVSVVARLGACTTSDRTHIRTSAGDWCVPRVAPVTLVKIAQTKNSKHRAKRPARKAA